MLDEFAQAVTIEVPGGVARTVAVGVGKARGQQPQQALDLRPVGQPVPIGIEDQGAGARRDLGQVGKTVAVRIPFVGHAQGREGAERAFPSRAVLNGRRLGAAPAQRVIATAERSDGVAEVALSCGAVRPSKDGRHQGGAQVLDSGSSNQPARCCRSQQGCACRRRLGLDARRCPGDEVLGVLKRGKPLRARDDAVPVEEGPLRMG